MFTNFHSSLIACERTRKLLKPDEDPRAVSCSLSVMLLNLLNNSGGATIGIPVLRPAFWQVRKQQVRLLKSTSDSVSNRLRYLVAGFNL